MQIVVVGCGKTGTELAIELSERGEEVVAVDRDETRLEQIKDYPLVRVHGVPIDLNVLDQAGLETADAVLCVSDNENQNIMVGQIAKQIFQVPKVIVRTFLQTNTPAYEELGLEPICTTTLIAERIINDVYAADEPVELRMLGTRITFNTMDVKAKWEGKRVVALEDEWTGHPFAVVRGGRLIPCSLELRLQKGDRLIFAVIGDRA